MIHTDEFTERRGQARAAAREAGLDALLVVGRSFYDRCGDVAWLTNHFPPFPACVFDEQIRGMGHALFLLSADEHVAPTLLVDGRAHRADLVTVEDVRASNNLSAALIELMRERNLTRAAIGIVGDDILPTAMYRDVTRGCPEVRWAPSDELLVPLRSVKSAAEQQLLAEAAVVADATLRAALDAIGPGAKESDVCAAGMHGAYAAGADFVRYLRVHSGPWSAWSSRWPQATERVIEAGDVVTLDAIGAKNGYQFDVLRTTVCGRVNDDQRRMLEAVLRAVDKLVDAARPGTLAEDLSHLAREFLTADGFGKYASPFVGHGIGLETCEHPYLLPGVTRELVENMVLCIEPGINIPDVAGCSIEQEVVVTPHGGRVITETPVVWW
jgi:Xaa-Pro aminopeptidase/Xaa-Pro dipeptidase